MTPWQLAADYALPYDRDTLYWFFSGEVLPPPDLVELVASQCGGDLEDLQALYDRAWREGAPTGTDAGAAPAAAFPDAGPAGGDTVVMGPRARRRVGGRRWPRGAGPRRSTGNSRLRIASISFAAVCVIVTIVSLIAGSAGGAPSNALGQPPVPAESQSPSAEPEPPSQEPDERPRLGAELVQNGTFTGEIDPWEGDDIEADEEGNKLEAEIAGGEGQAPQDADVDSNRFSLRAGRTYVLNFDAFADRPTDIGVTVQSLDRNAPVIFRPIDLAASPRHFEFTFTPDGDSREAIVSFELGGHRTEHQIFFDNVSLRQQRGAD